MLRPLPIAGALLILGLIFSGIHLGPERMSETLNRFSTTCPELPQLPSHSDLQGVKQLLSPLPPLPSEYSIRSEDQQLCDLFYGEEYLRHIASHQEQSCTDDSTSYIHRFTAPELPPKWRGQHWLGTLRQASIVRGVTVNPNPEDSANPRRFAAHCNLRNETELNEKKPDFAHGYNHNWRFGWDNNKDLMGNNCSAENNDGQWYMVHKREEGRDINNIWHKLMELWEMKLTLDALRVSINPATSQPWISAEDAARMRVIVDQPAIWDKWAGKIVNGRKLEYLKDVKPGTCLGNVVIPLEAEAHPFWVSLLERALHEPCQARLLVDTFLRQLYALMDITPRQAREEQYNVHPTVVIVSRSGTRKLWEAEHLIDLLKTKYPKSKIIAKDFGTMDLKQQMQLVSKADVFVSVHGAEMMHTLFLRPGSAVVELNMVPDRKFRHVSEVVGMAHFETRVLELEELSLAVNGTPYPAGWEKGRKDGDWQIREWAYLTDEQWLEAVGAGVSHQVNWRYWRHEEA